MKHLAMDPKVQNLLAGCTLKSGASPETLAELTVAMPVELPIDYLSFLSWSDGLDGFVGENYLILYSAEEVRTLGVCEYWPPFIVIGSDGGGEAFAYDTRSADMPIVNIPFIGVDEPPRLLGWSFVEFLDLLHRRLF